MSELNKNGESQNQANDAYKAYHDLQVCQLAEGVIHQAGRSAAPDFLRAVGYKVIELATTKGDAR